MVDRPRPGLRERRGGARERRRPHRAAQLIPARVFASLIALAALAAAGCESKKAPPPEPVIVTLTVPNAPVKVVRLELDARPIPLIDERHWKLTLPARSDPTTLAPRLRVVLPTTCGEEPIEVASVSAEGAVEAKWPAQSTVWVDRDGVGSVTPVSVGSFVIDATTAKVLVGTCPRARDVWIGEAVVGTVGTSTIVDAQGGHCYEVLTSGFPGARLEGKRTYERTFDVFLPSETPADKVALRRCGSTFVSFASAMGATSAAPPPTYTFAKPPKPPPTTPRKPRR